MELVGPSGKSISGSNKHILKLMIYQTFGHGYKNLYWFKILQYFLGIFIKLFFLLFFNKKA